jgi:hypothetical protein
LRRIATQVFNEIGNVKRRVHHPEMQMSTRTAKFASAIAASFLAGVPLATIAQGATTSADTSCLSGPKGVAPQGGHWYYRIDRATKRHCWYVGEAKQKPARTASENSQPAANAAASPADTTIQPSIANARAELPSLQTRIEETNAANAQQAAPAMIANTSQRAIAPDANAQRSIITSRWPESSGVNSSAAPGPSADNSAANAPSPSAAAPPPPVAAAVTLAAADSSSQSQTSQREAGSIQTLLAVILGALALAGLMGSAIFRFGSSRRIDMRLDRRAIWDSVSTDRPSRQVYPDVPMRRIGMPRELRAADDPDERIAQMLQRLARSAAT